MTEVLVYDDILGKTIKRIGTNVKAFHDSRYFDQEGWGQVGETVFFASKLKCSELGDTKEAQTVIFEFTDGTKFLLFHIQDCCEGVWLEDIDGDIDDLVGSPLVMAESVTENERDEYGDSFTWTFIKFGTTKGSITMRWFGTSNGWYSEDVDFALFDPEIELIWEHQYEEHNENLQIQS